MKYANNFLSEIILKIQFQNISEDDYYTKFEEFTELMSDSFPILTEYKSKEIKITSTDNTEPTVTSSRGLNAWVFRDGDKKLLTLKDNEITLQFNGMYYNSFEETVKPILDVSLKGLKLFNVDNINEIGIRYINQITNTNLTLNEILSNEYHFNFSIKNSIRSMNKIEFNEDNLLIIFNFGEFNDNYPSTNIKNDYILDYDCIFNQPSTFDKLEKIIFKMHSKIFDYFDKTTSNKFKQELGEL